MDRAVAVFNVMLRRIADAFKRACDDRRGDEAIHFAPVHDGRRLRLVYERYATVPQRDRVEELRSFETDVSG